jgi:hypothetical protein
MNHQIIQIQVLQDSLVIAVQTQANQCLATKQQLKKKNKRAKKISLVAVRIQCSAIVML